MKRPNASARDRHSLRWTLTVGAIAAALGFWGLFSQAQALQNTTNDTVEGPGSSSAANLMPPIPTLVPKIESSLLSEPALVGQLRRPRPITITRSSR